MKRLWIASLWLVAAAASAQIQIQSARWQVQNGRAGCDAERQMAEACDGRKFCQVPVDPRNLCGGDPAPGRLKSLTVGYSCYGRVQPSLVFSDGAQAALRCDSPPNGWQAPKEEHDKLQIYSARWEVEGGGAGCDATRQLISACDGKSRCQIFVDPRYLCNGDPAPGHAKRLDIRYACNGQRQAPVGYADFSEVNLQCGKHLGGNQPPGNPPPVNPPPVNRPQVLPPEHRGGILQIQQARWEVIGGGGWCDATPQLVQACNGKRFCKISVDPQHLCNGDPAPGQLKSLDVTYTCDGRPKGPNSYPDLSQTTLSCE